MKYTWRSSILIGQKLDVSAGLRIQNGERQGLCVCNFEQLAIIYHILNEIYSICSVLLDLCMLLFQLEIIEGCRVPVKLRITGDWRE